MKVIDLFPSANNSMSCPIKDEANQLLSITLLSEFPIKPERKDFVLILSNSERNNNKEALFTWIEKETSDLTPPYDQDTYTLIKEKLELVLSEHH